MSRRQSEPAEVILISEPLRLFKRVRNAAPLGFELTRRSARLPQGAKPPKPLAASV